MGLYEIRVLLGEYERPFFLEEFVQTLQLLSARGRTIALHKLKASSQLMSWPTRIRNTSSRYTVPWHVMLKSTMGSQNDDILRVLQEVVAPLVEADGGEIYLVFSDSTRVSIHLAGHHAGAPGNGLFYRRILDPAIHAVAPGAEILLTAGWIVPAGAVRLMPKGRD